MTNTFEKPAPLCSTPKEEAIRLETTGLLAMAGDRSALISTQSQLNLLASASPEYFRSVSTQLRNDAQNSPNSDVIPALTLTHSADEKGGQKGDTPQAFLSIKSRSGSTEMVEPNTLLLMASGSPAAVECSHVGEAYTACNLKLENGK